MSVVPRPHHISEAQEIVQRVMEMEKDSEMYKQTCEEAAVAFLDACSLEPTHDAVLQLTEAFLPALAIMCQRGYDPEGGNWRAMGWRGLLWEMHKRWKRIWFNGWKRGHWDSNNSVDIINYTGYYYRLQHRGEPWGEIGAPGND